MTSLDTTDEKYMTDDIMIYGIQDNSRYVDVDIKDDPEAVVLTVVAVHNGAVPETVTPEEAETEETK